MFELSVLYIILNMATSNLKKPKKEIRCCHYVLKKTYLVWQKL